MNIIAVKLLNSSFSVLLQAENGVLYVHSTSEYTVADELGAAARALNKSAVHWEWEKNAFSVEREAFAKEVAAHADHRYNRG